MMPINASDRSIYEAVTTQLQSLVGNTIVVDGEDREIVSVEAQTKFIPRIWVTLDGEYGSWSLTLGSNNGPIEIPPS